jgi:parallel beta-helix repeat protein
LRSSLKSVAALAGRRSRVLVGATALVGGAVVVSPVAASALPAHRATAAASATRTPIDVDGSYTFTSPDGDCPFTSLSISGFIGWTASGAQPIGTFDSSLGLGAEEIDDNSKASISITWGGAYSFIVSATASKVTLAIYNSEGDVSCRGENTDPESLSSLPTISGTEMNAHGHPYGAGVLLDGLAGEWAMPRENGSYEFWVQPVNTYTVTPLVLSGQPQPFLSECSQHATPPPNGCSFVVYPSSPPDQDTASWVYGAGIRGTVTDVDGSPLGGIDVNVTGTESATGNPVSEQTVSGSGGSYSFLLDPGTYSVTAGPDPAGGTFVVSTCWGTSVAGTCTVKLRANEVAAADFRRSTLVVNSTQLGTNQTEAAQGICNITPTSSESTCTLPQAILASNELGGQPIAFNISSGGGNTFDGSVPQIQDPTGAGMPIVTEPTVIDGTSQSGSGVVELSGTSAINSQGSTPTIGLTLSAAATVRGMVINGYSDGIDVTAAGSTVQDDFFGTTPAGTSADPDPLGTNTQTQQLIALIGLSLAATGNTVGGAVAGEGNVFAGHWTTSSTVEAQARFAAALYDTGGGNVIQGNEIGATGEKTVVLDAEPSGPGLVLEEGLAFDGPDADTIGGPSAGEGNLLGPHTAEQSISGGAVVQGNTFFGELLATGPVTIGGAAFPPDTAPGNTFNAFGDVELDIGGSGGVVQGNDFEPTGLSAVIVDGTTVTIGGAAVDLGNQIERAATDPKLDGQYQALQGGVVIEGSDNLVENNVITKSGGWGAVEVDSGSGNTITQNVMTDNRLGIEFGNLGYLTDAKLAKAGSGPNELEFYPRVTSASTSSSGTTVNGLIEQSGSVLVDFYSESSCSDSGTTPGQGDSYLGSTTVSSTLGNETFTFTGAALASGQSAITATATGPDGSTSEFSPCRVPSG